MKIIHQNLAVIESNHLGHFVHLPKLLGFDVHEVHGTTIINCGLGTSMFNIAYGLGTSKTSIHAVKKAFKGQPFAWWVPLHHNHLEGIQERIASGFMSQTLEHAMMCDLRYRSSIQQRTALVIRDVTTLSVLRDFTSVLEAYDPNVSLFYERIHSELGNTQEHFAVGYEGTIPVTIGIIFISGKSSGIFSLITREGFLRKGYGTDMMIFLMKRAEEYGCQSVTLSASSDSGYRIYERLGFVKEGAFACFEYGGEIT